MTDHHRKGRGPGHVSDVTLFRIKISLEWLKIESWNCVACVHGLPREVFVSWWKTFSQMDVVKVAWRLNFLAIEC